MQIHIGKEIEKVYSRSGMKHSEFAKRINTSSRNVYTIFKKSQIKTDQLAKISQVLGHDFFSLYLERKGKLSVEEPIGTYHKGKRKVTVMLELDGDSASLEQHIKRIKAINRLL